MPPRSPPHSDFDDNDSIIFTPISMVADEPHCPPAAPVTPRHTFQPHVTRVTWPRIVFCRAGSFYWLHFWNEAKGHEKGLFSLITYFWLRQELKVSRCPSVRPFGTISSRAVNLHLSRSDSNQSTQRAIELKNSQRALREHSGST